MRVRRSSGQPGLFPFPCYSSRNAVGPLARISKAPGFAACPRYGNQSSMCAGTLPPFAAICFITCLCSHIFMLALSFMSPV